MAIDVYSLCPGGTGKKIKFCCSDFVAELEKIDRMIDGQQYHACLELVRRLMEKSPTRACLMATECMMARVTDQLEEAQAAAARFVQAHPENPLAWAETAIVVAVTEGGLAAMPPLQKALECSGRELSLRVYDMLWTVAQILALDGDYPAAQAVLSLQAHALRDDARPIELLSRIHSSPTIPIWVREPARVKDPPADAPWKSDFEATLLQSRFGLWSKAADGLAALAAKVGDSPAIWYNLAILRAWGGEPARAVEALRKYASLDVPLEDAVEAEALALFLSDDPLGDEVDRLRLEYAVEGAEQLQAVLSSARCLDGVSVDALATEDEDGPPARAAYLVGSREKVLSAESLSPESLPRVLGVARLYGRETDRPARLEVSGVSSGELAQLKTVLATAAGPLLGAPCKEEVVGRVSATRALLDSRWILPKDVSEKQLRQLFAEDERDALTNRWPQLALGALGGKTPQEAAADPALRIRLLAAVLLVESWTEPMGSRFDFNQFRSRLGLPTLEPVDPDGLKVEDLPATRLVRLVAEKLSDEALATCFRRTAGLNATAAVTKFGQTLVDRPSFEKQPDRLRAYAALARVAENLDRALACVDEGRKAAEAMGQSSAGWDLRELSLRFQRGEAAEANRLLRHIESQHAREPGVASALQNMLVQFGLLRPDGTPAYAPGRREPEEPAAAVPAPGQPDESGKLWLPESQRPAGEKPRIWTPGMD